MKLNLVVTHRTMNTQGPRYSPQTSKEVLFVDTPITLSKIYRLMCQNYEIVEKIKVTSPDGKVSIMEYGQVIDE